MKNIYLMLIMTVLLSMYSCFKKCDPACVNGPCEKGECNCVPGYSGDDCSVEEIPVRISFSEIEIVDYPQKNDTLDWDEGEADPGNHPDVYFEIQYAADSGLGTNLMTNFSSIWNNTTASNLLYAIEGSSTGVDNRRLVFRLYDHDVTTREVIEELYFDPYTNGDQFPSKLFLKNPDETLEVYITISGYGF